MNELRVLDLFSGIGGFSLGLKRAGGFRTVAYCEIEPYCREVLLARMQDASLDSAPICTDIRALDGGPWKGSVEFITGGFPCQDISNAGRRAGIKGERSGLWSEFYRLICEIRPRFVIVENVAALLGRGIERVLGDLAESGYDAEWDVIPACSVGAPHIRERVWIVAYPSGDGLSRSLRPFMREERAGRDKAKWSGNRLDSQVRQENRQRILREGAAWETEPSIPRVVDGFPNRMERTIALGNAVVPQVVEWIGRRIREGIDHEIDE